MSELQVGTRVRTAAVLSAQDWSPNQNRLRQAGADGTIRAVHTPYEGEPWYKVAHGTTCGKYSAHELTPIRERARVAGDPSCPVVAGDPSCPVITGEPCRVAVDNGALRRQVAEADREIEGLRARQRDLEAKPEARAVEAQLHCPLCHGDLVAQLGGALTDVQLQCSRCGWGGAVLAARPTRRSQAWLRQALYAAENRARALDVDLAEAQRQLEEALDRAVPRSVLEAYKALHRICHEWTVSPAGAILELRGALQTLHELGVSLGEPPAEEPEPDSAAPPPSDAAARIEQLTEIITRQKNELAGLLRTQQELTRITTAIDRALHLPGCDHPVERLLDEMRSRLQLYDQLADPEAYDTPDPAELAEAVLRDRRTDRATVTRQEAELSAVAARLRSVVELLVELAEAAEGQADGS